MTTTETPDERYFERAVRRIVRFTLALMAVGTAAEWIAYGWPWALGFLMGAAASFLNFRWLKRFVDALGRTVSEPEQQRPSSRVSVLLGMRYVFLGIAAYAILRYSPLSVWAALTGLFVAVAAVIIEILFELVYVRK